jgi:hypothetical protein
MNRFKEFFFSYYRLYRHFFGIRHCVFQAMARHKETYFFDRGWGDSETLRSLAAQQLVQEDIPALEIQWSGETWHGGGFLRKGRFESPMPDGLLDPEARNGLVELHLPKGYTEKTPICIVFAMTGDEGFEFRYKTVSRGLLKRGIGTLLLENAYYGARKPRAQRDFRFQTVQELLSMSVTSVREGKGLLNALRAEGFQNIGVAGVSQGGMVASLVGALAPYPVPMAISLAAHSPEIVLAEGLLSCFVDWSALEIANEKPEQRLREIFKSGDVTDAARPRAPERAFLLGAKNDRVVPKTSITKIHQHWPGSKMRWIPGTHVTSILWHSRAFRRLIHDAMSVQA